MLANKAEVRQSVQGERFWYCGSNQGPLMALIEPPGEFPANHSLLNWAWLNTLFASSNQNSELELCFLKYIGSGERLHT